MGISRITDSMMNYGFLSGMNKSLNAQYSLMEQTSDGKRIHRPSDDPVRVIRSLQYRSAIMQNEQYVDNVKMAQSWMEMTDKAVGDLSDIVSQAKSLVVRAIEPNSTIGYAAAAKQLDGLIEQALQVSNTQIGDRYIFAGQMDKTQPFQRVMLADPTGQSNLKVDTVVYYGDDQKISMVTQSGLANVARDGINLTGLDVFGRTSASGSQYGQATTDVFNALIRIKEELEKTAAVTKTNPLGGTLDVDGGYTGPADYQDFAVKIDALKVRLNGYAQSNAGGGSLALGWTGAKSAMPAAADQVEVTIDAVGVKAGGVNSSGATAAGQLALEYTGAIPLPPLPTNVRMQIDAVQGTVGKIAKSNALSGEMSVVNNAYTGVMPAPQKVEISVTAAAGQVTGATYRTYDGTAWSVARTATVAPLPGNTITLNDPAANLGIVTQVADDTENLTGDTYTFDFATTGKVLQTSYATSNDNGATWSAWTPVPAAPNPATDNSANPFRFTLGATGYVASISTAAANGPGGTLSTTGALTTSGQATRASYRLHNALTGWSAMKQAAVDTNSPPGSFILGDSGFTAAIAKNSTNSGGNTYTLTNLSIDAATEAAALSYSLDKGNTWTKATAPTITKFTADSGELTLGGHYTGLPAFQDLKVTVEAWKVSTTSITQTPASPAGGAMKIAYNDTLVTPMPVVNPQVKIDAVDSSGRVTGLSYFDAGTWTAATAKTSQGPTVFSLGGTFANFSVSIDDNANNAVNTEYTTAGSTLVAGDPALISYTTEPAPDVNGTVTPSASVWSMKGADADIPDFVLADGVTADIEANSATVLGTSTYSFRVPPRFALTNGVEVSVDPNANNLVKDAHTFHMARDTEHTAASDTIGPDLDWLSDKGLADLDMVHDQILTAVVDVGTRASMYEMTGNMLESSYVNLTAVMASNEDIDMAQAIIDMKTAENTYKAALSFGSRVMPVSLVDFLR